MIIRLNLKESELYFLTVPENYKNFKVVNYGYMGAWLMEIDSHNLNRWEIRLPHSNYEVLGFVKDVIEGEITTNENFVLRIL